MRIAVDATLATLGVVYEPLRQEAAELAGVLWREYCLAVRRRDRDRIVADFLIGAHAQFQADALLLRDRGFFGSDQLDLSEGPAGFGQELKRSA